MTRMRRTDTIYVILTRHRKISRLEDNNGSCQSPGILLVRIFHTPTLSLSLQHFVFFFFFFSLSSCNILFSSFSLLTVLAYCNYILSRFSHDRQRNPPQDEGNTLIPFICTCLCLKLSFFEMGIWVDSLHSVVCIICPSLLSV